MANVHTFPQSHQVRQLIAPAAQGSLNTAWVAPFSTSGTTGDADRAVFFITVGTLDSDDTIDVELHQAKDSSGTDATALTADAIAVLTQVTDDNDETIKSIEIGPGALNGANGYTHVRVEVTVANGTPVWGVFQVNHRLRYPGANSQHSTYDEQVLVLG